jgi:hypothetical protein
MGAYDNKLAGSGYSTHINPGSSTFELPGATTFELPQDGTDANDHTSVKPGGFGTVSGTAHVPEGWQWDNPKAEKVGPRPLIPPKEKHYATKKDMVYRPHG